MPRIVAARRSAAPLPTQKTHPRPDPDTRVTRPVRPAQGPHPIPTDPARPTRSARPIRKPEQGRCQRCGGTVIACWDAQERLVPVHPVAVPGGELIVNASQARIVQVLSHREASAAHRRGELGFLPHARICRGLGYVS